MARGIYGGVGRLSEPARGDVSEGRAHNESWLYIRYISTSKYDVPCASVFCILAQNPDTKVHHILVQFGTQNYSKSIGHEEEAAYFTFSLRYEVCQCADVHLHHASLYRCRSSPRHLYILSRGLVALNHRVGFDGAVPWR